MITVQVTRSSGTKNDRNMNYKLARKLERELRRYTPVRTGNLRRGWDIIMVNGRSFTIVNEVYYGAYVEDGTATISPRRFTRKAVRQFERSYDTELLDYDRIEITVIEP